MKRSYLPGPRSTPWYRKVLYSLIPTVVLLGLAELILLLAGVQPISSTQDPFVGFAGNVRLYAQGQGPSDSAEYMTTRPSKLNWFNFQSFPKKKPTGTKRIVCLGGSTTFGRPFSDVSSYSGWLRQLLKRVDPDTNWEVINAGGVSYASYRVASIMEEMIEYEPDLFVVYSVHNEFLERRTYAGMFKQSRWSLSLQSLVTKTRTFAVIDRAIHGAGAKPSVSRDVEVLPSEVDERLNHTIGPADYHRDLKWETDVLAHYELNLRRMVAMSRDVGAQILFVTPASNERNCSPFKSEFSEAMTQEQKGIFAGLIGEAFEANKLQEFSQAADLLKQAQAIVPRHADTDYLLGQAYWELGKYAEAKQAFSLAIDNDICPLRATSEIDAAIRTVASDTSAEMLDFNRLLHDQCFQEFSHRCLGEEYFLDHVHPTRDVHRQLAIWILERLTTMKFVSKGSLDGEKGEQILREIGEWIAMQVDEKAEGVAFRNLAKVLHWSGKFEEAAPRAMDALELLPNDPESRLILADCLKNVGETERALSQYGILIADHPNYQRSFLPFGTFLAELGKYEPARGYLIMGVVFEPNNAFGHFTLGQVHLKLGEYDFAVESLSRANELYPNDPATLDLLAQAQERVGDVPLQVD